MYESTNRLTLANSITSSLGLLANNRSPITTTKWPQSPSCVWQNSDVRSRLGSGCPDLSQIRVFGRFSPRCGSFNTHPTLIWCFNPNRYASLECPLSKSGGVIGDLMIGIVSISSLSYPLMGISKISGCCITSSSSAALGVRRVMDEVRRDILNRGRNTNWYARRVHLFADCCMKVDRWGDTGWQWQCVVILGKIDLKIRV